jgi:hypothetical protein
MGVRFHRNTGKYRAQHRDKYLGLFATVAEAAAVVEAARAADPIVYQPQPAYLVDEDIAAEISAFRWTTGTGGYMQRGRNGMKLVVMHRLAWKLYGGSEPQSGHEIDHINRDPSDNRRCNLRLVTRRGNTLNRRSDKCVRRHKSGSWEVRVAPNASDGFNRCYQDEETARLVARHVREKLIEREVIEYLKEKNDGSV